MILLGIHRIENSEQWIPPKIMLEWRKPGVFDQALSLFLPQIIQYRLQETNRKFSILTLKKKKGW